jgi:hypothetical protein
LHIDINRPVGYIIFSAFDREVLVVITLYELTDYRHFYLLCDLAARISCSCKPFRYLLPQDRRHYSLLTGGILLALYVLPLPPRFGWFPAFYFTKLLVSHILKEEPYRPEVEREKHGKTTLQEDRDAPA